MLNLIWPSLRRPDVGTAASLGRVLHWMGAIVAALCLMLAAEFAVEGWAGHLSLSLLIVAIVLIMASRAVRYMLARE